MNLHVNITFVNLIPRDSILSSCRVVCLEIANILVDGMHLCLSMLLAYMQLLFISVMECT